MTLRTRFLITVLFLCHQLPASSLVTSRLLTGTDPQKNSEALKGQEKPAVSTNTACSAQAALQDADSATICADSQEKIGNTYKLQGNAEIHYRTYILRADELTYNADTDEITANGHFSIDGGPNDDHIQASHGTYNVTAETIEPRLSDRTRAIVVTHLFGNPCDMGPISDLARERVGTDRRPLGLEPGTVGRALVAHLSPPTP